MSSAFVPILLEALADGLNESPLYPQAGRFSGRWIQCCERGVPDGEG